MADLKFTYLNSNNVLETITPYNFTTKPTLPALTYYKNNVKTYIPLITKTSYIDIDNYRYSYDSSLKKTIHCCYNNTEYVVPNKKETLVTYDIPAGTYTPTAFENLIKQFISLGRSRKISLACSVVVNNQAITVNANTSIYYVNVGTSPWNEKFVCFGTSGPSLFSANSSSNGFTQYKSYCVGGHRDTATGWASQFAYWSRFSIKIFGGIKFV